MNFMKYHVSKNLWNYEVEQGSVDERKPVGSTFETVNSYISPLSIRAISPVLIENRALSCDFTTYNLFVCYFDDDILYTGQNTGSWQESVVIPPVGAKYAAVSVKRIDGVNITPSEFNSVKLMLNSGSTALPYEPYSSEVWHDTPHYIHNTSTDTIATLPAVLYPNGTTATVGLKGNAVQSSTPSPTSPVMPNGTGERTGNLFDKSTITTGAFAINTGVRENASYYCSDYISITATTYYFQNVVGRSAQNTVVVYDYNKQFVRYVTIPGGTATSGAVTFENGEAYIRINCYRATDVDTVMVNLGSTPLPYEPYGIKIPISSANTTTNIYLGEVQTTRKIRKLVLTGEENWNLWSIEQPDVERYYYKWGKTTPSDYSLICTHLPFIKGDGNYEHIRLGESNREDFIIFISRTIAPTIADFKSYLAAQYAAGTPVTVWYVLANKTTGIVNEPLMKIGDYADEVSGITIPTIAGANIIDVGTTLKPSEVSVNYHGWHPVQSVHERENGQWD